MIKISENKILNEKNLNDVDKDSSVAQQATNKKIFLDYTHSLFDSVSESALEKAYASRGIRFINEEMNDIFSKKHLKNHNFNIDLGVINSPYDDELMVSIKKTLADIKRFEIDVKHVVLAGIGGSELGATALISSCGDSSINYYPITSLNNDNISEIIKKIVPKKTILIMVSRSGTTKETLTSFSVIQDYLKSKIGENYKKHCVAILGSDKQELAKKFAYHTKVIIQPKMSGRFTVFHAANLFTMAIMGVDVKKFIEGAKVMLESCIMSVEHKTNDAFVVAYLKYLMNKKLNKTIFNTNVFSPKLVKYGDWLDQLTEESLGHNEKTIISTKTTELSNKLHSDFQNWWAGANVFYHQFVFPLHNKNDILFNPLVENETLNDVELAAYLGTVKSLFDNGRPSFTTFIYSVDEYSLGQLLMRDFLSMIYLGELFELSKEKDIEGKGYFNQPGVESYKKIMKHLLENKEELYKEKEFINNLTGGSFF